MGRSHQFLLMWLLCGWAVNGAHQTHRITKQNQKTRSYHYKIKNAKQKVNAKPCKTREHERTMRDLKVKVSKLLNDVKRKNSRIEKINASRPGGKTNSRIDKVYTSRQGRRR